MSHTAGRSQSDLPLHVSDPPLHVLSSSWLSAKLSLSTSSAGSRRGLCLLTSAGTGADVLSSELLPGNYLKSHRTPGYCGSLPSGILETETDRLTQKRPPPAPLSLRSHLSPAPGCSLTLRAGEEMALSL